MDKEISNLEKIKETYEVFRVKYSLPDFAEMNSLFDIEDMDCETDLFLRKLRRAVSEKLIAELKLIEMILNPSSAPMFFFQALKNLNSEDKEFLNQKYQELGFLELEIFKLDLEYREKDEIEYIRRVYSWFLESKQGFVDFFEKFTKIPSSIKESTKSSYLG
jgi:hypothetical protein